MKHLFLVTIVLHLCCTSHKILIKYTRLNFFVGSKRENLDILKTNLSQLEENNGCIVWLWHDEAVLAFKPATRFLQA